MRYLFWRLEAGGWRQRKTESKGTRLKIEAAATKAVWRLDAGRWRLERQRDIPESGPLF